MTSSALSRVFAALADPTRRDMVARLSAGAATVNQLAEPYQLTLQAIYKHLKVLEDAGVVSRPPGPQPRTVRLEAEVFDLMDKWIERYRRQAEERYRRLDAVLARMNDEPGRPEGTGHPDEPRLQRDARAAVPCAHRSRALRAVGRAERHADARGRV